MARTGSSASRSQLFNFCSNDMIQAATIRLNSIGITTVIPEAFVQIVLQKAEHEFDSSICQTEPEFRDWLTGMMNNHLNRLQHDILGGELLNGSSQIVLLEESNFHPDERTSVRETPLVKQPMSKENRDAVEAAVDLLPEPLRLVLLLHNRDGYSFDDIAARTGRTIDETRLSWARAIELLKDHLPRIGE